MRQAIRPLPGREDEDCFPPARVDRNSYHNHHLPRCIDVEFHRAAEAET